MASNLAEELKRAEFMRCIDVILHPIRVAMESVIESPVDSSLANVVTVKLTTKQYQDILELYEQIKLQ